MTWTYRLWASVVLVAVISGAAIVGPAAPAHGCSCVQVEIADALDGAAAAFVGIPVARTDVGYNEADRWPQGVLWTFGVETVLAGEVAEVVEVASGFGGGDCGYDFSREAQIGVIAHGEAGALTTSVCGGAWSADTLLAAHGPGQTPLAVAAGEPPRAGAPMWWWVAGAGGLLALIAGAGIAMRNRSTYQDGWTGGDARPPSSD